MNKIKIAVVSALSALGLGLAPLAHAQTGPTGFGMDPTVYDAGVDMITNVRGTMLGNLYTILPIGAVVFITVIGVRWALRWFFKFAH